MCQSAIARQKERICGTCSTDLCPHLLCRTCYDCPDCDTAEGARVLTPQGSGFASRATAGAQVPTVRDPEERMAWLKRLGIADADLEDADRALCELRSDCCACQCRKRKLQSFCSGCWNLLPVELRPKLYLHFKFGYLTHVREAWAVLRRRGRITQ